MWRGPRTALTVLGPEEAGAMGMGMFMPSGGGCVNPPRFIALRSGPAGPTDFRGRLLALVGKGVTLRLRRHQHQAGRAHG